MAYAEKYVEQGSSGGDGNDNVGLSLSNATYDHTGGANELQLTSTGSFSGYTFATGDVIWLTNAAGGIVVPAQYAIAAKIDNNIITLVANAGLTGDSTADVDSTGGPWTLAEAFTNATGVSVRVNVKSNAGYTSAADTIDGVGTIVGLLCYRGYNTLIGDLENQGWNSDGTLDVTNYPAIQCDGAITMGASGNKFMLLQNMNFTGALSSPLVGDAAPDHVHVIECKFTNTQNNSSAIALRLDNTCSVINCDLECSGAAHDDVLSIDSECRIIGCRIKGTETSQNLIHCQDRATIVGCMFEGPGIGAAVSNGNPTNIVDNTFYKLETAITLSNVTPLAISGIVNNHITDCGKYIDNLNSGSANVGILEVNNRTRANTTPRTGVGEGANVGEITTETNGESTDFVNFGSGDFHLIDAAPGQGTGTRAKDIGAYKAADPAGGGGGNSSKQAGVGGGQVG